MAVTIRQRRFVEEYLVDLNATQAAVRAGYRGAAAGSRLLADAKVRALVAEALAARGPQRGVASEQVAGGRDALAVADAEPAVANLVVDAQGAGVTLNGVARGAAQDVPGDAGVALADVAGQAALVDGGTSVACGADAVAGQDVPDAVMVADGVAASGEGGVDHAEMRDPGGALIPLPDAVVVPAVDLVARVRGLGVTPDRVLGELVRIAFADVGAALAEGTAASLLPKANHRLKALELLGRHLGMFRDKVELTGQDGGPIDMRAVCDLSDEELAAELARHGLEP